MGTGRTLSATSARTGAALLVVSLAGAGLSMRDHRAGVRNRWGGDGAALRLVDVNRAGMAELMLLPGIGPGLSKRILEDREARGAFVSVKDLERVRGIGARSVGRVSAWVLVR